MSANSRHLGNQSEQQAYAYLSRQGLKLITRNHHCRHGEIDLVMQDGQTLVFVEVRSRSSAQFGSAIASISSSKQKKIIAAAQHFLMTHPIHQQQACRFDVIGMDASKKPSNLQWIKNAFVAY